MRRDVVGVGIVARATARRTVRVSDFVEVPCNLFKNRENVQQRCV